MTRIKNAKFLLVTAALVWFGLMAVMMINQPVTATPAHSRLTPPFTFEQAATSNAANIGFPYPGNTVIFTETFGASFAPTTPLDMAIPAWHVAVNPGASDYYWGRVNTGVFSDSAWSAVSTITSTTILTPGVDFYPADQDT